MASFLNKIKLPALGLSKYKRKVEELEAENRQLKFAAQKASESDHYLKVAVKSNLDAIICVNSKGNIVLFNPAAEELFQYSEEEVLNQPVEILISDKARKMHGQRLGRFLEDGVGRCGHINRRTERSFQKKDGTVFPGEHSLAGARFNDKIYLASTIHDLTETKKKEQKLKKSEERLKLALESTNIGMWDHNLKTGKVYRSGKWAEMLGYKPEEIDNDVNTWKSLIHEDDLEIVEKVAEEHESKKMDSFKVEHRLRTKDGRYKWVLNWGKITEFDQDGTPIRALGAHIDIDDRKRTEEFQTNAYNQFVSVLESIEALIYVVDFESKEILFMNKIAKDHFGDKEGESWNIILKKYSNFPDEAYLKEKILNKKGEPSSNYKWEFESEKSGRWYDIIDKAIYWPDGRLVLLQIAYDVTERKQTEKKLQELNATKDRLFSIIGHDLKNPLSDIIGFSELLYRNFPNYSNEKTVQFHQLIFNSAKATHNLLENLLEWARFHRGKLPFNPEKFDLRELSENTSKMFKNKVEGKNITLSNEISESVFVYADKNMIQTVLRNLLSNAIKFTPKAGSIQIKNETRQEKTIISVADNGMGISQEKINKIFKKENNITTEGTLGETGTGLGLLICKDFIDKHDESIWVESEEGNGSEFKFTLPLDKS